MVDMVKLADITERDSKKAVVDFEPKIEVTKEPEEVKPKVLVVVDDSKKSKLMLAELKERKVNVVSEVKADFKNVAKEVQDIIKSESDKHNDYQVVYLPVTNDDYNKNAAEYTKLRSTATVPINLYFQDRTDVDIANKAFTRKIE